MSEKGAAEARKILSLDARRQRRFGPAACRTGPTPKLHEVAGNRHVRVAAEDPRVPLPRLKVGGQ
jgi:hypothetical protein